MEHRSVWLATADRPSYPRLEQDLDVDLVVVGGGITGLTTALLARRDGARVAVLEARTVGEGTTGKTTGKVSSQHSVIYDSLVSRHGVQKAQQYADANQAGMQQVASLTDELGIDCELTWASSYAYTTQASQQHKITDEYQAAEKLGLPVRLEYETELPVPVEAAVVFDDQIHLHAGRYVAGLARGFVDAGGHVYENTRVTDLHERGSGVEVRTAQATVRARHVVLATLLPIRYAGAYFAKARPTRSYGLALRLRGKAPRGMGISIDTPTRSTRPWLDPGPGGMILVGNDHETGTQEDTASAYRDLEEWARENFDVEAVDYRWSSQDFVTQDMIPYVGRAQGTSRTYVATGFRKWGLSNGTAAAMMITDELAGRSNPWLEAFDAKRIGGLRTIAGLAKDNAKVGKEFVAGHLGRLRASAVEKLGPGEGGLVHVGHHAVGAYRDPDGKVHAVGATCTHMGCRLNWNNAETSWDCPCHGSRFDVDGGVLDGPAVTALKQVEVDEG